MSIKSKIQEIQALLSEYSERDIKLLGVSKYANTDQIHEAYKSGLKCFAENYVIPSLEKREELLNKYPELTDIEWHLIGALQKNKVKKAVGNFTLIHSVDSLKLAEQIGEKAKDLSIKQDVLLQINLTGEEQKSGFSESELISSLNELSSISNIQIRGLMTMGPSMLKSLNQQEKNTILQIQKNTETIYQKMSLLKQRLVSLDSFAIPKEAFELSMGMSNDFELALKYESTIIRIGRRIFG